MKTLRNIVEPFVYTHMAELLALVEREGADAVIDGVRIMDADMVRGSVLRGAVTLYLHYCRTDDPRKDETAALIRKFAGMLCETKLITWGKLMTLTALVTLKRRGVDAGFDEELIGRLKAATDYGDFFDRGTMTLMHGYPSNYLHVAMNCAGLREYLGWENGGYREKIAAILFEKMQTTSQGGWLDEEPPYGRFDSYAFVSAAEIAETCALYGADVPAFVKDNVRRAAEACLFMANNNGDGFCYGRSLSVHADTAVNTVLGTALAYDLLSADEMKTALDYSAKICGKIIGFWYRGEKGYFDLWSDGRRTDDYRSIDRLLETDMDIMNRMIGLLENYERVGLADAETGELPSYEDWVVKELVFREEEGRKASAVILRKGDALVMLPLIGLGRLAMNAAYMPFPASPRQIEACPDAAYPFLVPEYVDRLSHRTRPVQHYDSIEVSRSAEGVCVTAKGHLSTARKGLQTDNTFEAEYRFIGNEVSALFSADIDEGEANMIAGCVREDACLEAIGFEKTAPLPTMGAYDAGTPHGGMQTVLVCHTNDVRRKHGYKLQLKTK